MNFARGTEVPTGKTHTHGRHSFRERVTTDIRPPKLKRDSKRNRSYKSYKTYTTCSLIEGLLSDLPADLVFLLVKGPLFLPGNMAAVLTRHDSLLSADLMVFRMEPCCFSLGHLA